PIPPWPRSLMISYFPARTRPSIVTLFDVLVTLVTFVSSPETRSQCAGLTNHPTAVSSPILKSLQQDRKANNQRSCPPFTYSEQSVSVGSKPFAHAMTAHHTNVAPTMNPRICGRLPKPHGFLMHRALQAG